MSADDQRAADETRKEWTLRVRLDAAVIERDRLRAELAEIRSAGNALAEVLNRTTSIADPDLGDRLRVWREWRSVRGDACTAPAADVREPGSESHRTSAAAGDDTALLTLDELTDNVENALECAAIEVVVWETDMAGARASESSDSLHRLTRCLRSYGLLDERRGPDGAAGNDIAPPAEPAVLASLADVARVCETAGLTDVHGDRCEWTDPVIDVGDGAHDGTWSFTVDGYTAVLDFGLPGSGALLRSAIQVARGGEQR